jgi:hypothetical protein
LPDTDSPRATDQPEAASTSSTPPAESQSDEDRVASLGERILTELDAGRTNNTLTRWLAHHTAALIDGADQAVTAGASDAATRVGEARAAVLELWEHRSSWPDGWPPPRAAEIVRLLNDLPALDEEHWRTGTVLDRLQRLHYQILGAMVDLTTGGGEPLEQGWLANFGDRLTADEVTLLTRAAETDNRIDGLIGWFARLVEDGTDEAGDTPSHPLTKLADTYRQTVLDCLQRATSQEVTDDESAE